PLSPEAAEAEAIVRAEIALATSRPTTRAPDDKPAATHDPLAFLFLALKAHLRGMRAPETLESRMASKFAVRAIAGSPRPRLVLLYLWGMSAAAIGERDDAVNAIRAIHTLFPDASACDFVCAQIAASVEPRFSIALLEGLRDRGIAEVPLFALLAVC